MPITLATTYSIRMLQQQCQQLRQAHPECKCKHDPTCICCAPQEGKDAGHIQPVHVVSASMTIHAGSVTVFLSPWATVSYLGLHSSFTNLLKSIVVLPDILHVVIMSLPPKTFHIAVMHCSSFVLVSTPPFIIFALFFGLRACCVHSDFLIQKSFPFSALGLFWTCFYFPLGTCRRS
jgi:hypothetical protein